MKKYLIAACCILCSLICFASASFADDAECKDGANCLKVPKIVPDLYSQCSKMAITPEAFYRDGLRAIGDLYRKGDISDKEYNTMSNTVAGLYEKCGHFQNYQKTFKEMFDAWRAGKISEDELIRRDTEAINVLVEKGYVPENFRDKLLSDVKAEVARQRAQNPNAK